MIHSSREELRHKGLSLQSIPHKKTTCLRPVVIVSSNKEPQNFTLGSESLLGETYFEVPGAFHAESVHQVWLSILSEPAKVKR